MIRRKKIDCLVIGDCFFDVSVKLSSYNNALKTGGVVKTNKISVLPGGIGNVSAAIAKLGGTVALCGVVGNDALGRAYIADLNENFILPEVHTAKMEPTGLLLALLSSKGERSFVVSRGANDSLEIDHVKIALRRFDPSVVFISGYSLTKKSMEWILFQSIDLAIHNKSKIVFDCTPFNVVELKRELFMNAISKSYCTCLNFREACSLVGTSSLKRLIKIMRQKSSFFVLTLGSKGCLVVTSTGEKFISTKKVSVKDTNGAGDSFAGAIAYGISRNLSESEMGTLGVYMGTLKVQFPGPRIPDVSQTKINRFKRWNAEKHSHLP